MYIHLTRKEAMMLILSMFGSGIIAGSAIVIAALRYKTGM